MTTAVIDRVAFALSLSPDIPRAVRCGADVVFAGFLLTDVKFRQVVSSYGFVSDGDAFVRQTSDVTMALEYVEGDVFLTVRRLPVAA
jgi:hypothetical protein